MAAVTVPTRELFINGSWTRPAKGGRIPVVNPATEETVGSIPAATKEDVEAAVQAAHNAFHRNKGRDWARTTGATRAKALRAIAAKITERKSELAKLESVDMGKPLDESEWDMDDVSGCFEYYAQLAEELDSKQYAPIEVPMDTFKTHVLKEALGVAALITPWNYPLLMATWKVAPALAAGCTVVLKPSEMASITCLELAAIAQDVGLPAGVFNVITGLGEDAGAPLSAHPLVDKVAFTGSTVTGRAVMQAAASNIKPVTLELGGKSPIIVFDDADIEKAVEWVMFGIFWTNGQICTATSRLILQEGIAEEFNQKFATWASSLKISDPLEPGCRLGPIVSEVQYKKVIEFVEAAKTDGCKVITGGKRPSHLKKGFFLEPTALEVTTDMQIWQEEVFGPVLAIKTFSSEEEALELANNSPYGLGAAVISQDEARCKRVSEALQAGIVWVNCSQPCFCQAPWGGTKRSGFGRELGEWGLDNYLSVKQVTSSVSNDAWGWYPKPARL